MQVKIPAQLLGLADNTFGFPLAPSSFRHLGLEVAIILPQFKALIHLMKLSPGLKDLLRAGRCDPGSSKQQIYLWDWQLEVR